MWNYFGIFYKFIDVLLYLLSLYCIKFSYRFPLILWCQTYTSFFFFFSYNLYYCKKYCTFRICKSVLSHHLFSFDFISVKFFLSTTFMTITVSLFIILFYLSLYIPEELLLSLSLSLILISFYLCYYQYIYFYLYHDDNHIYFNILGEMWGWFIKIKIWKWTKNHWISPKRGISDI